MAIVTPSVTKRLSAIQFTVFTKNPSSPSLLLIMFLPHVCSRGVIKAIPATDKNVSWKEASPKIFGVIAAITAAANPMAVIALFCRPSRSANRKILTITADRITGGPIPVSSA